MKLHPDDRILIAEALGIGWRRSHGRTSSPMTPWRNRSHAHRNGERRPAHDALCARGLMVRDPRGDYGSILIYRVTTAGAAAIGKKLPAKLAPVVVVVSSMAEAA